MRASTPPPRFLRMFITTGCFLLLACTGVQTLVTARARRAAIVVACTAAAAHAAIAHRLGMAPLDITSVLAAFGVACVAIAVRDRNTTRRLHALATLCDFDETTHCLNRRGFAARLEQAAANALRSGQPMALLALDLDHFKQVNDQFGHLTGDAVLGEVGASLMATVGHRGMVARLGGEEFAVLLPEDDAEGAGEMAERILATLRSLQMHSLPPGVRITMSIGIAAERIHDMGTTDALRARADEALYAGKRSGRDRALLWAPGVQSHGTPARSMRAIGLGIPPLADRAIRP